mmetsp:Transcript_15011/g.47186  ORF Transcript_15011/g.47186 Transcript_15011/m.47186 type:complete len:273 (+) Transcript_15011:23-841(+)
MSEEAPEEGEASQCCLTAPGAPAPPACCEKLPCARIGEKWCQCFPSLERHRFHLMTGLLVLQILVIIPACIAIVGLVRDKQLTFAAWAVEDIDGKNGYSDFHLFIGLRGMYVRGGPVGRTSWTWTEAKKYVPDGKKDNLNSCKHAASDTISTVILGLFTVFPSAATIYARIKPETDTGCQKFLGIMSGCMGCYTTLNSLGTFLQDCYQGLPTRYEYDGVTVGEGSKEIGAGAICESLVAGVALITAFFHLILPVPEKKEPLMPPSETTENPL